MTFLACLAAWCGIAALVCWIAGRFIRAGMVDRQPGGHQPDVQHVPNAVKQSVTETCVGCRHDDRSSGPINLVDLLPVQLCRLDQPRLWSDRRCERFERASTEKRHSIQKLLDSRKAQQ